MKENFNPQNYKEDIQNYRDSLAKNIKGLKKNSPEEAIKMLGEEKKTEKFQEAQEVNQMIKALMRSDTRRKKVHEERYKGLNQEQILSHNEFKTSFVDNFAGEFVEASIDPLYLEKNKESLVGYQLLKDRLRDSILVDLGCGSPFSTDYAYQFATAFGVKKYIGVEKYTAGKGSVGSEGKEISGSWDKNDYEESIRKIQIDKNTKKLLKNKSFSLPDYEFALNKDMLSYLSERTEQSNFLMSGVDHNILRSDHEYDKTKADEKNKNYIKEVENKIADLTPVGGIVIVVNSVINLERFGFKKSYLEKNERENSVIWEKI